LFEPHFQTLPWSVFYIMVAIAFQNKFHLKILLNNSLKNIYLTLTHQNNNKKKITPFFEFEWSYFFKIFKK